MVRYLFMLSLWGFGLWFVYWKSNGNWQVVAAVATWFLAATVAFAYLQLREARKSTKAQIAVELFRELRSNQTLEKLRSIYSLKPEEIKRLSKEEMENNKEKHEKINHVLDRFELLGALVKQGIIDERLAIEAYGGPPVLKCWYKLGEHFIKEIRKQRGLFCKYVQDFAKCTVEYQLKHVPKDEWIYFLEEIPLRRDGDRVNLIEILKGELLSGRECFWAWFIRYSTHPWWICKEKPSQKNQAPSTTKKGGPKKGEASKSE